MRNSTTMTEIEEASELAFEAIADLVAARYEASVTGLFDSVRKSQNILARVAESLSVEAKLADSDPAAELVFDRAALLRIARTSAGALLRGVLLPLKPDEPTPISLDYMKAMAAELETSQSVIRALGDLSGHARVLLESTALAIKGVAEKPEAHGISTEFPLVINENVYRIKLQDHSIVARLEA